MAAKAVKRICKRVLANNLEVKVQTQAWTVALESLQTGSTTAQNWQVLSPSDSVSGINIARGTANNQMIGNRVRTKSATLIFTLQPQTYNATTNPYPSPCFVRCYLFRYKNYPTQPLDDGELVGGSAIIFENGTGTTGFSGQLMDMNRKLNRDQFTYLAHRTFKVGPAMPTFSDSTDTFPYGSNNDFKLCVNRTWNITKYLEKEYVKPDDNFWSTPWLFCLWQVVGAIPGIIPTAGQSPMLLQQQLFYRYTDA